MSLLQFKPAPMYILDEIDAALDLSHTQHIGQLFRNRFKGSQFIVVSLKEGLFTNANVLFKAKVRARLTRRFLILTFNPGLTPPLPPSPSVHRRDFDRRTHSHSLIKPKQSSPGPTVVRPFRSQVEHRNSDTCARRRGGRGR